MQQVLQMQQEYSAACSEMQSKNRRRCLCQEEIIARIEAMTAAERDEAFAAIPDWQIKIFDEMFGT
jgi:hypothetical protein